VIGVFVVATASRNSGRSKPASAGTNIEITKGLQPGEEIISRLSVIRTLRPGAKVTSTTARRYHWQRQ